MEIKLYHRWTCPYSNKVRNYIEEHQLQSQIAYIELDETPEARETVKNYAGTEQTPCLVVNDRPILESSDIISWLDSYFIQGSGDAIN
jgi:glutaredoxin 3